MSTTRKAIIVGAGIAGLATALRLRQIGWEPVVFERAPARRTGGYVLHLSGLGYEAAERLNILTELRQRHFGAFDLVFVKPDGRLRFSARARDVEAMLGGRNLNLLRSDVEAVLYDAVRDQVDIRFDAELQDIEQDATGVRAVFADGTVESADLLIGADGRHSKVRSLLFGPEETFRRDLNHMVAAFMLDRLPETLGERVFTSLATTGRTLGILNIGPDRTAGIFAYHTTDPAAELARGSAQALADRYGDLGWIVPDLLDRLRHSQAVHFDSGSEIVLGQWSKQRVVLLGDSAWLMPIYAGYGASLAIGAADRLGTALAEAQGDIPAALHVWETALHPEARKKQRIGRRNARVQIPRSPFHLVLRDLPVRIATSAPAARLRRLLPA
ncbi:FAD-dependent monooxygenase [Nonomuraea turcica]|uniref:FAD-dependent monooxygenase n=1 Tax=Nonomuraea sp. G32 TaxID=3067274 RepID=UPI00273B0251|nr:FAD-dependent monooxygenase [Nonomuraea sp. G32]MDP4505438.1 FAD-dependent monooxygenase [Nonomuraea sp. G32]